MTQGKTIKLSTAQLPNLYRGLTLALLAGVGLFALFAADRAIHHEQQLQQQERLERVTRLIQLRLHTALQTPLNTVAGMRAFMLATPQQPSFASFDRYAAEVIAHNPVVHGFAYVDAQRVIRHFYPMAGNEQAIGLNLMTRPAAPFVERAIRERLITVSPPTVTVQGPLAAIVRMPLFRNNELLGLVQAVIDIDKALAQVTDGMSGDVLVYLEDERGKRFWGADDFHPQAKVVSIPVGDSYWHARVWLDRPSTLTDNSHTRLFGWLVGVSLLLTLLFIVNRTFSDHVRLSVVVDQKTAMLETSHAKFQASESRWRSLLEQVRLISVSLDRHGYITYVNAFFCEATGYDKSEVIGKNWFRHILPKSYAPSTQAVFSKLDQGIVIDRFENPILTKNGDERVISWFNTRLTDDKGEFDGTFSIGEDITARLEIEKRLDYLAYHDPLTGLPNRMLFMDRLDHAMRRAQRDDAFMALLMIDLDQFKTINDSLGHRAGDILLQAAAQRFQGVLRYADTVARIGGDEFTILLENIRHVDAVEAVAKKILDAFAAPFEIDKHRLYISTSIGIALYPFGEEQINDLLQAADTAMYHVKASGRNSYRFYEANMVSKAHDHLSIANNLHAALAKREFSLVFQPIVELAASRTVGVEALLRWKHAERGWISPVEFIPIAESTGLIINLGYWVLREACRTYGMFRSTLSPEFSLSVNVSAQQFRDKNFINMVRTILMEEEMHTHSLTIEITESQLMEDTQRSIAVLQELQTMGCRIAIDDFGTGYSSLSYLKLLPIDILKIDRSFIMDLDTSKNSVALLQAIMTIADSLNIAMIAEGVETDQQLAILKQLGLKLAQGYYLGKPQPWSAAQQTKYSDTLS